MKTPWILLVIVAATTGGLDDVLPSEDMVVVAGGDEGDKLPAPVSRGSCLLDLSTDADVPTGCSLRKYSRRVDGVQFFVATLPTCKFDALGHHSRTRSWTGPRALVATEAAAIFDLKQWLHDHAW